MPAVPPATTDPAPPGGSDLAAECRSRLATLRASGLERRLRALIPGDGAVVRTDAGDLLNFASNDYLALSRHPELIEASARAARDYGAGASASRLVTGSFRLFHELEESLADWQGAPAARLFATGYSAAVGTIPALVGRDDHVVVDRLVHACCLDAARLSGATLRVFRHNDSDHLDQVLRRIRSGPGRGRSPARILVVTESVFSMDGDVAPLRELVEVKERHGAWLMLDEAHAAGLRGPGLAGVAADLGLAGRVDIHMGTLGKAVGAAGGFVAGPVELADLLIHRARSLVFSTAPAPAAAAAARAGVHLLRGPEGAHRSRRVREVAARIGTLLGIPPSSAILPWIVGDELRAVDLAGRLEAAGILVPAIRHPTVGRGLARLRFTATAGHPDADIDRLEAALRLTGIAPNP